MSKKVEGSKSLLEELSSWLKERITKITDFIKSEGAYWITVITILVVIELLLHFWFIPKAIISTNLGLNLMSEIVGILFTVIFLSLLFKLREREFDGRALW